MTSKDKMHLYQVQYLIDRCDSLLAVISQAACFNNSDHLVVPIEMVAEMLLEAKKEVEQVGKVEA